MASASGSDGSYSRAAAAMSPVQERNLAQWRMWLKHTGHSWATAALLRRSTPGQGSHELPPPPAPPFEAKNATAEALAAHLDELSEQPESSFFTSPSERGELLRSFERWFKSGWTHADGLPGLRAALELCAREAQADLTSRVRELGLASGSAAAAANHRSTRSRGAAAANGAPRPSAAAAAPRTRHPGPGEGSKLPRTPAAGNAASRQPKPNPSSHPAHPDPDTPMTDAKAGPSAKRTSGRRRGT